MATDKMTTKHEITLTPSERAAFVTFLAANEAWLTPAQAASIGDRVVYWLASQIPAVVDTD